MYTDIQGINYIFVARNWHFSKNAMELSPKWGGLVMNASLLNVQILKKIPSLILLFLFYHICFLCILL